MAQGHTAGKQENRDETQLHPFHWWVLSTHSVLDGVPGNMEVNETHFLTFRNLVEDMGH